MKLYFKNTDEFYNSGLWKSIKIDLWNKRKNEEGQVICEHCGKPIIKQYARLHHKEELTDQNVNDPIASDYNNLAWVHFTCHNLIHHRFSSYERKVFLVVGSPCSGKSTWVESVATKDDLVLDVDQLWKAISINDLHIKNYRFTDIAMALRNTMLEQIQARSGSWVNCYVITSEAYSEERKRMCIRLGIKASNIVTMEATEEECLKRLNENPNGRDLELYTRLIKKFYSRYQPDEMI